MEDEPQGQPERRIPKFTYQLQKATLSVEVFRPLGTDQTPEQLAEDHLRELTERDQAFTEGIVIAGREGWHESHVSPAELRAAFIRHVAQAIATAPPDVETIAVEFEVEFQPGKPVQPGDSESTRIPSRIRQQTAPEIRTAGFALTDGPYLLNWTAPPGEVALIHSREDAPFQAKLLPGIYLTWGGSPQTVEGMQQELREAGLSAALLVQVCVGMAIHTESGRCLGVELDKLIQLIGEDPRTRVERQEWRRKIWRWIGLGECLHVIGQRRGTYPDRLTGELIDTTSRDPLLKITGTEVPAQLALDGSEPPLKVSWVLGDTLYRHRKNRRLLSEYGDILKIAAIPSGKPAGAWARSIGMGLNQFWRERSARARLIPGKDGAKSTVQFPPITRRDLLSLFRCPPEFDFEMILDGANPKRAREYWDGAVGLLQQEEVIGFASDLKPLKMSRQGWQKEWLDQPLDIRPTWNSMEDTQSIAASAEAVKQAVKRKRGRPRKRPENGD